MISCSTSSSNCLLATVSLYGGQFTLSTQSIKQLFCNTPTDAAPPLPLISKIARQFKKTTFISLHKKNPYIELFSKMEFKRFSEFHFSRNREMSAFARMELGANPKIGKFCECWAASQSKIRKKNWHFVLYQVKVCHLGFLKKVSLYFLRLIQNF